MDTMPKRRTLDSGERLLRWIARLCVVPALCWAGAGAYLVARLDLQGMAAWAVGVVAFAPLYLLYAVAGEVLGVRVVRRWMSAVRMRVPPNLAAVLGRRVGGPGPLLLAVAAAITLAWLLVGVR